MKQDNVLRCTIHRIGDNTAYWFHFMKVVFRLDDQGCHDLRDEPPYVQILPCPYCGVTEDKGHKPLMHVNTKLGISS